MTTPAQRATMLAVARTLVQYRSKCGYEEIRPYPTRTITTSGQLLSALKGPGILGDCSSLCKTAACIAKLRPPDGIPYADGAGNTETFYNHLPHYMEPALAGVGAFVFFGQPEFLSTQHLCYVTEPGEDPELFSHGGTGAFAAHFVRLSVERRLHVDEPVFLSIAAL